VRGVLNYVRGRRGIGQVDPDPAPRALAATRRLPAGDDVRARRDAGSASPCGACSSGEPRRLAEMFLFMAAAPPARRRKAPAVAARGTHRALRPLIPTPTVAYQGYGGSVGSRADPRDERAGHRRRAARPHAPLRSRSGDRLSGDLPAGASIASSARSSRSTGACARLPRDHARRAQACAAPGRRRRARRGRAPGPRESCRSSSREARRDSPASRRAVEQLSRALEGGRRGPRLRVREDRPAPGASPPRSRSRRAAGAPTPRAGTHLHVVTPTRPSRIPRARGRSASAPSASWSGRASLRPALAPPRADPRRGRAHDRRCDPQAFISSSSRSRRPAPS